MLDWVQRLGASKPFTKNVTIGTNELKKDLQMNTSVSLGQHRDGSNLDKVTFLGVTTISETVVNESLK